MKALLAVTAIALAGCATGMSPEQLRASAGMSTCTKTTTIYGTVTFATTSADDTRKGATQKSKTVVTCGDASMAVETDTGVAPVTPAVKPTP